MPHWITYGFRPAAGMYLGPGAWIVSTQLNYPLSANLCGPTSVYITYITAALVLVSLVGALLSWTAWQHLGRSNPDDTSGFAPHKLMAGMGSLIGVLFAFIIALQGTATFFIPGCAT